MRISFYQDASSVLHPAYYFKRHRTCPLWRRSLKWLSTPPLWFLPATEFHAAVLAWMPAAGLIFPNIWVVKILKKRVSAERSLVVGLATCLLWPNFRIIQVFRADKTKLWHCHFMVEGTAILLRVGLCIMTQWYGETWPISQIFHSFSFCCFLWQMSNPSLQSAVTPVPFQAAILWGGLTPTFDERVKAKKRCCKLQLDWNTGNC